MQMPCTGIAEIAPWTFCVLRGSDSKKIEDFSKFRWAEKKKFRDSALIEKKYANAMHSHSRNRTLDLLRSQGVRMQKNRRFFQIPVAGKKKFRDSALIGPNYANAMHKHSGNRTLDLLRSERVRQQKIADFSKFRWVENKKISR